jgi:hypothetical protein
MLRPLPHPLQVLLLLKYRLLLPPLFLLLLTLLCLLMLLHSQLLLLLLPLRGRQRACRGSTLPGRHTTCHGRGHGRRGHAAK